MRIHRDIENLPVFENAVVTIGSFDGLHIGHKKIIDRIKKISGKISGTSVIITFDPHPRQVIYPKDKSLQLLNTLDEKIEIFSSLDFDHLVVVPFSVEFSQIHPKQYVEEFIIQKFHPSHLVIGYDHKFGLNRSGDIDLLRKYADEGSFHLVEIPKQEIESIAVSSTKIRHALFEGDVDKANLYLGGPYVITGKIVHGNKIGKSLGYPTANLQINHPHKLIPAEGIYAVEVQLEGEFHQGMMYIGSKPTLKQKSTSSIEINIFNFSSIIYGKTLKVYLYAFLREDQKFDNISQLEFQIKQDEKMAKEVLKAIFSSRNTAIKTAVVILNNNGKDHLESYLPGVLNSSQEDFQVFVIDNGSEDDSVDYLKEWHPEIKLIQLDQNYGFAEGYNKGLQLIQAQYFVLLNTDVKVVDHWIDPLIEVLDSNEDVACIQPKILSLEDKRQFEYAGAAGGVMDNFYYPLCRGRVFQSLEEDLGQYDGTEEIFWASGAAFVIKAELFKRIGGFDGSFFAHQEEIDLCWRIKNAGYKILVISDSIVYHLGGGTLSYDHPFKTFLNFRNNHLCYLKNESLKNLWWKIPVRWALDFLAFFKFLLDGKIMNAIAIIRAYLFLALRPGWILQKRKNARNLTNQNRIGQPNSKGFFKQCAVWRFYVRKQKTFSKITAP